MASFYIYSPAANFCRPKLYFQKLPFLSHCLRILSTAKDNLLTEGVILPHKLHWREV